MIEFAGFLLILCWLVRRAQRRDAERERQAQAVLRSAVRVEPELTIPPRPGLPASLRPEPATEATARAAQAAHDLLVETMMKMQEAVLDAYELGMNYSVKADLLHTPAGMVFATRITTQDRDGKVREFRRG